MRIGIISDTHIRKNLKLLDIFLNEKFHNIDFIIHAGDFTDKHTFKLISNFKKTYGVCGNNDSNYIVQNLKEKEILELQNYRIGIFHGHGLKGKTLDRAYEAFEVDQVDVIIFGHSHQPIVQTKNKVLMINPGSPTSKRKERWYSYVILEITNNNISVEMNLFSKD